MTSEAIITKPLYGNHYYILRKQILSLNTEGKDPIEVTAGRHVGKKGTGSMAIINNVTDPVDAATIDILVDNLKNIKGASETL